MDQCSPFSPEWTVQLAEDNVAEMWLEAGGNRLETIRDQEHGIDVSIVPDDLAAAPFKVCVRLIDASVLDPGAKYFTVLLGVDGQMPGRGAGKLSRSIDSMDAGGVVRMDSCDGRDILAFTPVRGADEMEDERRRRIEQGEISEAEFDDGDEDNGFGANDEMECGGGDETSDIRRGEGIELGVVRALIKSVNWNGKFDRLRSSPLSQSSKGDYKGGYFGVAKRLRLGSASGPFSLRSTSGGRVTPRGFIDAKLGSTISRLTIHYASFSYLAMRGLV